MMAVIIDDGVSNVAEHFQATWFVDADFSVKSYAVSGNNHDSHADTCFKIISKYSDSLHKNICWHSIKILDTQSRRGNINSFLSALNFSMKLGVKLIHLSIGTTYFMDFECVKDVVTTLVNNGVIIVAALSNAGIITYPASMERVIGVKQHRTLREGEYFYVSVPINSVKFAASSDRKSVV